MSELLLREVPSTRSNTLDDGLDENRLGADPYENPESFDDIDVEMTGLGGDVVDDDS